MDRRNVMASLAMIGSIALMPWPASAASEDSEPVKIASLTADQARALDFRQMFGLDDDIVTIVRASTDRTYSSANYGVPLSSEEESELQRRVQVEYDSHAAADFGAKQSSWAGYYFDQHSRGAPVFLFTSDEEEMRSELGALLPSGTVYRVNRVEHSLTELVTIKERIVADWESLRAKGIHVTATGIDTIGNAVTVAVDGLSDSAVAEIQHRCGTNIVFRDEPAAESDACPTSNCRPLKGGIKITGAAGFSCTAGFVVRRAQTALDCRF